MTIRSFAIAAGLTALMCAAATIAPAQSMDSAPYNPETDPDIDLYMSHWSQSMPRHMYGSLIERDIFVPGADASSCRRISSAVNFIGTTQDLYHGHSLHWTTA